MEAERKLLEKRLEKRLAAEIEAVNEISAEIAERCTKLAQATDEETIRYHYVRARQLMDDLGTRYEWSRYAGIELAIHRKLYPS
jgi:ribosomal protein L9